MSGLPDTVSCNLQIICMFPGLLELVRWNKLTDIDTPTHCISCISLSSKSLKKLIHQVVLLLIFNYLVSCGWYISVAIYVIIPFFGTKITDQVQTLCGEFCLVYVKPQNFAASSIDAATHNWDHNYGKFSWFPFRSNSLNISCTVECGTLNPCLCRVCHTWQYIPIHSGPSMN